MELDANQIGIGPLPALLVALCLVLPCFALAARVAPWSILAARAHRRHLFFGALVLLPFAWSMSVPVAEGVSLHLLYLTTVTLILDWPLAIVVGLLARVLLEVFGDGDWLALPINLIINVILPVFITRGLLLLTERLFEPHVFIYMLGIAFGGAMLGSAVSLGTGLLFLDADTARPLGVALLALVVFPEGFVNGLMMTGLTIYRPHWLRTYDDRRYLGTPDDPR